MKLCLSFVWFACFLFDVRLADDVPIGGLFHTRLEEYEKSFMRAIEDVNENGGLGDHKLVGVQESVPELSAFQAGRAACRLMQGGVAGIVGPQSVSTAIHVQSICDTKEVPHIETRWDWQQPRGGCSINLYPHPSALTYALMDVVKAWGWKTFIILYQDENSLASMSELLKTDDSIVVRQLESGGNYREVLKDILRAKSNNIIIDCSSDILLDVFTQAQQVGIMVADYSYIITNLDLQSIDLEFFKYAGTNITGFRMNSFDGEEPMLLGAALVYDSVQIFASALGEMTDSTNITTSINPLNCSDTDSWAYGYTLINLIKSTELNGLTGVIKFDHEGFRTNIELTLIELTEDRGMIDIGVWNSTLGLNLTRSPSTATLSDSGGSVANKSFIVLITLTTPPYAMLKEQANKLTGNDRYEGFAIDLIHELSLMLGFNYTFVVQEDGVYGNPDKVTGEWNGMLGEIIKGQAHLAITDLTINEARASAVDFTMPFMTLGIQILYKIPTSEKPSLLSFMSPFSPQVWWYVLGAYLIVSVLLFVQARISPYEWTNPYPCIEEPEVLENQFSLANSLWFTIGSLLQQGSEIAPIAVSTRMVAGIWWFFTLIMVSSYTANLAAFLVVEQKITPFSNVKELANNKQGIMYGAKKNGSTANFFLGSDDETYKKMGDFMREHEDEVFPDNNDEGVQWVKDRKYAFLMESSAIEYTTERNCEVAAVGGLLDNKGYGIAMKKNSSYRNELSTAVLHLQEKGRLFQLKDKWWKEKRGGGKCSGQEGGGEEEDESLGLENVGGVFVVLIGGVGLGCFITIFEMLWNVVQITITEKASFKEEFMEELRFVLKFHGSTKPVRKRNEEDANDEQFEPLTSKDSNKTGEWFREQ